MEIFRLVFVCIFHVLLYYFWRDRQNQQVYVCAGANVAAEVVLRNDDYETGEFLLDLVSQNWTLLLY